MSATLISKDNLNRFQFIVYVNDVKYTYVEFQDDKGKIVDYYSLDSTGEMINNSIIQSQIDAEIDKFLELQK